MIGASKGLFSTMRGYTLGANFSLYDGRMGYMGFSYITGWTGLNRYLNLGLHRILNCKRRLSVTRSIYGQSSWYVMKAGKGVGNGIGKGKRAKRCDGGAVILGIKLSQQISIRLLPANCAYLANVLPISKVRETHHVSGNACLRSNCVFCARPSRPYHGWHWGMTPVYRRVLSSYAPLVKPKASEQRT